MSRFDEFATEYEVALSQNLRFIPGGVNYYYQNRVNIAIREMASQSPPERILDFGGGVGLTVPLLCKAFPRSVVSLCDASAESTSQAKLRYPYVEVLNGESLPERHFDLIFVAGVIHHIDPANRHDVLNRLSRSLALGGLLILYELNPLNPITRRLVRCCPFDDDAELISKGKLKELVETHGELRVINEAFMVFLPPVLGRLARLEQLLKWCPLGAQYYLTISHSKNPSWNARQL